MNNKDSLLIRYIQEYLEDLLDQGIQVYPKYQKILFSDYLLRFFKYLQGFQGNLGCQHNLVAPKFNF